MSKQSNNSVEWKGEERRSEKINTGLLKKRPFSKMKKKLLIYFLMISFISLVVGLEMIWEVGEPKQIERISNAMVEQFPGIEINAYQSEKIFEPIKVLQLRMLGLLLIVGACIAVTLGVFIKKIANPLDEMIIAAKQVRDGNLSVTVPVVSKDEIGQLGDIFNDLSVNLQEVLLFVAAVDSDLTDIINEIHKNRPVESEENKKLNEQIDLMSTKLDEIKDMVQSFNYYNVTFDGEHVMGNEPANILEQFKDLT